MFARRPRNAAVVEAEVMGRAAVAVLVAVVLAPTAIGQLTGATEASDTLDGLGVPHLTTVWAVTMLIGVAAMAGSYVARRPDDTRILEIAANALIVVSAAVHGAAILDAIGYSGATWAVGLDAALIINCGGRAVYLTRQILWVARRNHEKLG